MTTTAQIAKAAKIAPRTKTFVLRGSDGIRYDGGRTDLVLAAISRSDITPELSARIHTVAYAVRKSLMTGRMDPATANRIACYSAYQVCALVAKVAAQCPEETIGAICDGWLVKNYAAL